MPKSRVAEGFKMKADWLVDSANHFIVTFMDPAWPRASMESGPSLVKLALDASVFQVT